MNCWWSNQESNPPAIFWCTEDLDTELISGYVSLSVQHDLLGEEFAEAHDRRKDQHRAEEIAGRLEQPVDEISVLQDYFCRQQQSRPQFYGADTCLDHAIAEPDWSPRAVPRTWLAAFGQS